MAPHLQPRPLVYRPVHQASSGGYPPTPQGILQKKSFFFFFALETQKYDASCEICSVPGARAPTTYPPRTKAPGPSVPGARAPTTHRPGTDWGATGFLKKKDASCEICSVPDYHLPPQNQSPWTPLPSPCTPTPQGILKKSFFFFLYALE